MLPYWKQITLACLASQFYTELGPAQPQLVYIFCQKAGLQLNISVEDEDLVGTWFPGSPSLSHPAFDRAESVPLALSNVEYDIIKHMNMNMNMIL